MLYNNNKIVTNKQKHRGKVIFMLDSKAGNKKGNSNFSNTQKHKVLEVGKFYLIHDGSPTGHPGYIVWKNDSSNEYLVVITESDKPGNKSKRETDKRHLTDLEHPTEPHLVRSYIKKKPLLCKRKDIGSKQLTGMKFHPKDLKKVLYVSKQKPALAPSKRK